MGKPTKTVEEKLATKVRNALRSNASLTHSGSKIKIGRSLLIEYSKTLVKYSFKRYYPDRRDTLVHIPFKVTIKLNHKNLKLLGSNLINPPYGTKVIYDLFKRAANKDLTHIHLGGKKNKLQSQTLYITKDLYEIILKINQEEGKDKAARFHSRTIPFINSNFSLRVKNPTTAARNYSLLFQEIIASGQFTQADILSVISELETGENNSVIIEKQINKQVEWLIDKLQEIIDESNLTKPKAQELGNKFFGFSKLSISGPEHLMEMILSKYGKNTLFGVPVLLNTDKYVVHQEDDTRSQFDIILINHLSDIELVELKRPDAIVLSYDKGRNKFYASKDLSIAVSQAERYISAVYRDNDENYLIDGLKIKAFLTRELSGSMNIEICRPKALIIIGSHQTIAKDYNDLTQSLKDKVSLKKYTSNYLQAYKELKEAYKNIHILTYSELLDNARTRFYQEDSND